MEDNRENIESADEEKKDTEQTDGMKMIGNETDTSDCNDDPQEERNEQTLKDPEEKKEEAEPQKQTFKSEKKVKKCPSWLKTTGKVIGVMALTACASFGGTYAAITFMEGRMSSYLDDQLTDFYDDFDFGYGHDSGNGGNSGGGIFGDGGSNGSAPKTNDNSAGLGVYIYNSSDEAQIAAFTDDSLADDAGLQVGDIIIFIDGKDTDDYDEVVKCLKDYRPGDTVKVGYEREGVKGEVEVELIDRNTSASSSDFPSGNGNRYMQ